MAGDVRLSPELPGISKKQGKNVEEDGMLATAQSWAVLPWTKRSKKVRNNRRETR